MATIVSSKNHEIKIPSMKKKMDSFFKIAENGHIFFDSAAKKGQENNVVISLFLAKILRKIDF